MQACRQHHRAHNDPIHSSFGLLLLKRTLPRNRDIPALQTLLFSDSLKRYDFAQNARCISMDTPADITVLLENVRLGDRHAEARLLEAVYGELRRLAAIKLRAERPDHTLQPSALVHEAYLRLVNRPIAPKDRSHFFSLAATVMRNILVDHARAKNANRRQWGVRVEMQHAGAIAPGRPSEILALDAALAELATLNPRHCQIVELHFFAGMTFEEIAGALDISSRTAKRDWDKARSWLQVRISGMHAHDT